MKAFREITDQEWGSVESLLPECQPQSNRDPRGRPMKNRRACMNATLFVMFTGVSWQMLPRKYPSYQTCHRCFKAWYDAGVMHKVAAVLFAQESPDFLALVAARVRIALRETRGGVDRAVKRTDAGIVKKVPSPKPATAIPVSSKRGASAGSARRSKAVVPSTRAAAGTVAEQARSKKAAKAPIKSPIDVSVKRAEKPRATAPLKALSKVTTKGPSTSTKTTKSAKPINTVKAGKSSKAGSTVKTATRLAVDAPSLPIAVKRAEKALPKSSLKRADKQTPKRASNRDSVSRERSSTGRSDALRSLPAVTHAAGSRPLKSEAEALQVVGRGKAGERRSTKAVAA